MKSMPHFIKWLRTGMSYLFGMTVNANKNVTAEGDVILNGIGNVSLIIDSGNGAFDGRITWRRNGVNKWRLYYDEDPVDSFRLYDMVNAQTIFNVIPGGDFIMSVPLDMNGNILTDYRTPPTGIDDGDSPYTLFSDDAILNCDTDAGAITANLPPGIVGEHHNPINVGTSGNDVTVNPDGAELLNGVNGPFVLHDGESFAWVYSATKGWR